MENEMWQNPLLHHKTESHNFSKPINDKSWIQLASPLHVKYAINKLRYFWFSANAEQVAFIILPSRRLLLNIERAIPVNNWNYLLRPPYVFKNKPFANSHRDPRLLEVELEGHGLPHEDVGVVTRVEDPLQLLELPLRKVGPRTPPFGLVALRICKKRSIGWKMNVYCNAWKIFISG